MLATLRKREQSRFCFLFSFSFNCLCLVFCLTANVRPRTPRGGRNGGRKQVALFVFLSCLSLWRSHIHKRKGVRKETHTDVHKAPKKAPNGIRHQVPIITAQERKRFDNGRFNVLFCGNNLNRSRFLSNSYNYGRHSPPMADILE